MKKIHFIFALSAILALSLVLGCAKAPTEKVDAAKAALEQAKTAEADRYFADDFKALNDSLNVALVEIEKQNSRYSFSRKYSRAVALLDYSTAHAASLAEKTAARKAEVKAAVDQKVIDINLAVSEAKGLLAKAPKGKEGRQALEDMKSEITTAENTVPEITTLVNSGDYLSASDKATAVYAKVTSINDELKSAIAKVSGKARKSS
jgi:hypothetical protein